MHNGLDFHNFLVVDCLFFISEIKSMLFKQIAMGVETMT